MAEIFTRIQGTYVCLMQIHELSLTNIGCNPSKGGLFRSGPILKGDACIGMQNASNRLKMGCY